MQEKSWYGKMVGQRTKQHLMVLFGKEFGPDDPSGFIPKFNHSVIYSHRRKTAWHSVVTIISAASGSFPDFEDNQQGLATAVL